MFGRKGSFSVLDISVVGQHSLLDGLDIQLGEIQLTVKLYTDVLLITCTRLASDYKDGGTLPVTD